MLIKRVKFICPKGISFLGNEFFFQINMCDFPLAEEHVKLKAFFSFVAGSGLSWQGSWPHVRGKNFILLFSGNSKMVIIKNVLLLITKESFQL